MSDSMISRRQAKQMVAQYRKAPDGGTNPDTGEQQDLTEFVHFTFAEFFGLFTKNKIAADGDTIENILQNKSNFGIKIYFAQHADTSDCPDDDPDYIGRNTVLIANTVKVEDIWYDMPDTDTTIAAIKQYASVESGLNADKGELCPPKCTSFANNL